MHLEQRIILLKIGDLCLSVFQRSPLIVVMVLTNNGERERERERRNSGMNAIPLTMKASQTSILVMVYLVLKTPIVMTKVLFSLQSKIPHIALFDDFSKSIVNS